MVAVTRGQLYRILFMSGLLNALLYIIVGGVTQVSAEPDSIREVESKFKANAITLEALTQCMRRDNPALNISLAHLESAKSKLTLAEQSVFPSLSMDSLIAPLPARRLLKYCVSDELSDSNQQLIAPCPHQDIQDDARLSDVDGMGIFVRTSATLTQPLYTFGKIKHGKEAAAAGVRAYESLVQIATRRFDASAAQAYYGLALTKRAQKVFKKGKVYLKKVRAQIDQEIKAQSGKYTTNDLRKLNIKESELGVAAAEVDFQRRRAISGIQISCPSDTSEGEIALESDQLNPIKSDLKDRKLYIDQALSLRPEMIAAKQQLVARQALRSLARANFFPDLALVGTFGFARGTSAEDNPDPFANDPFNVLGYGAYLGLRWKLNFAQLNSKLQEADAAVAKAQAELDGLRLQLEFEITESYLELEQRREKLKLRKEAMRQAKQWVTSTLMSRGSGLIDVKTALEAITAYFTTSLAYDREVYEYNLSFIGLVMKSGGDPLSDLKP